jgi:tetratricopeptide (TPR) repeat protein
MVIGAIALAFALQSSPPQPAPQLPEVITRSRVDPNRGVDFHAMVVPETVYVGQQATYQLGVFLDQDTRQRIRRNPEFQPPETRSLLSYDLRERPPGSLSGSVGGRPYEMHVFRRALFPLTPGRYPIPPARLTYALPQTASFFSREESFALRSEAVDFIAIEPPLGGRPSDWAGAVGTWRASARIDTARGRAGEPIILTMRIEGTGNVTLLPRPHIAMVWAGVVNADERVRLDSTPALLGGWKEFDWLVTPTASGLQRVPALRYAFFNPRTRAYEIASTAPIEVRVTAGDFIDIPRAAPAAVSAAPVLPIESALSEPAPPPLANSPVVLVVVALGPLVAFFVWIARRPRKPRPPPTPRQRLAKVGARADTDAVREVRRALVDGLTARTGLDAAVLTAEGAWTIALRKKGLSADAASAFEELLSALDEACFAATPALQPRGAGWAQQAREALDVLDDELWRGVPWERRVKERVAVSVSLAILLCATAPPLAAQGDARDAFALGATAYSGGDYIRAARHFADAAREAPRSTSAWSNLGTASLMAHDTAMAVLGWQRALRLDPTNSELRLRLAGLRVPQEGRYARVYPIPGAAAIGAALLIWLVGWVLTIRQGWRRHSAWRLGAVTAVAGSVALFAAWKIESHLEGRNLVVVTNSAPLRALPSLTAESRSTPVPGEVAAVIERKGVWVRLRLDGARDGWLPVERVAPLGRD